MRLHESNTSLDATVTNVEKRYGALLKLRDALPSRRNSPTSISNVSKIKVEAAAIRSLIYDLPQNMVSPGSDLQNTLDGCRKMEIDPYRW